MGSSLHDYVQGQKPVKFSFQLVNGYSMPMTFSLVGRSMDGKEIGVAVASKFLAAGAYVPAAKVGAGGLATQAYGHQGLRTKGLDMLASGMSATVLLRSFFKDDGKKEERQVGVVDAMGNAATYTGNRCMPWAGGKAENHPRGSYAAQGNMLAGPEVVDEMVEAWLASYEVPSLAQRLVASLAAGQAAGGDPRGKQSAAVLVVAKNAGYGGQSDVMVDLRSDDAGDPIVELQRMLVLHELYFGVTPDEKLLGFDAITGEIKILLKTLGYASGNTARDLYDWMGKENFEERWHDGKLDPVVLEQLRLFAKQASA